MGAVAIPISSLPSFSPVPPSLEGSLPSDTAVAPPSCLTQEGGRETCSVEWTQMPYVGSCICERNVVGKVSEKRHLEKFDFSD